MLLLFLLLLMLLLILLLLLLFVIPTRGRRWLVVCFKWLNLLMSSTTASHSSPIPKRNKELPSVSFPFWLMPTRWLPTIASAHVCFCSLIILNLKSRFSSMLKCVKNKLITSINVPTQCQLQKWHEQLIDQLTLEEV